MAEVDYNLLENRAEELFTLINSANHALSTPESHLSKDFTRTITRYGPRLAARLGRSITKGKPEEAIIGGAIIWIEAKTRFLVSEYKKEIDKQLDYLNRYFIFS